MPLFTFRCRVEGCKHEEEVLCSFKDAQLSLSGAIVQDCARTCPVHEDEPLYWRGVERATLDERGNGNNSGRFQMRAITDTGQKIDGHFGKSARRQLGR